MIMKSTIFNVQNAWEYIQHELFEYIKRRENIFIILQYWKPPSELLGECVLVFSIKDRTANAAQKLV